jgi:hypothetical protein
MTQLLIFAIVHAIIIGVAFWVLQELISLVPMSATFAKLVNIILILLTLIVAYDLIILPVSKYFGIYLPHMRS